MFKIKYEGVRTLEGLDGVSRLIDALKKQNEKAKDVWYARTIEVTDDKKIFSFRLVNKRTKKSKVICNDEQMTWLINQLENGNIKVTYKK